jgi:hypothetical protein
MLLIAIFFVPLQKGHFATIANRSNHWLADMVT